MEINVNNYPAYILDYYEGSLSTEQQAELLLFLENHPGLKSEFESFELLRLSPDENVSFPSKDSLLKKEMNEKNLPEFLAARMEGDLSPSELGRLDAYLKSHPQFQKDEKLFALAKLVPDYSIVFQDKRRLKKPVPMRILRRTAYLYYAAAASVVLLIGSYLVLRTGTTESTLTGQVENRTEDSSFPPGQTDPDHQPAGTNTDTASAGRPAQNGARPAVKRAAPSKKIPAGQSVNQPVLAENNGAAAAEEQPAGSQPSALPSPASFRSNITADLIKEKLAEEISGNPASFSGDRFEAFLDRVIDGDSALSNEEFHQPVFIPQTRTEPAAAQQTSTPLLNALAWGISKVTDEVALRKNYDDHGDLVAYQLEAGLLKFGNQEEK